MKIRIYCICFILLICLCAGCGQSNKKDDKATKERTVLTYGYIDADPVVDFDAEIEKQVVKFNRNQNEYILEIRKYGEDNYAEGLAALNADIASGKGPDIIQIDNDAQYWEYASKNMLEDLYLFIDEDEQLQREDFFLTVLKQFEYNSKLCGLSPFFAINSTIGNPNYISDEHITFEEFCEMWENRKDIEIYQPITRERVLSFGCGFEMDTFVDLQNHSCSFNSEEFVELLMFSKRFVSQREQIFSTCELYKRWQDNRICMMYDGPITTFDGYTKYKSMLGQDAMLIGWPTVDGCGPQLSYNFPYLAINSNSKEKEVAWEFIRGFLQTDFLLARDNERKGFPILEEAFELRAQEAMEIIWGTDETGEPIEIPDQGGCIDRDGTEINWPVYAATKEEVDYIRNVINELEIVPDYGEISSMIYEEANYYWNGSKSAQEVADIIQNRVQLYMEEKR